MNVRGNTNEGDCDCWKLHDLAPCKTFAEDIGCTKWTCFGIEEGRGTGFRNAAVECNGTALGYDPRGQRQEGEENLGRHVKEDLKMNVVCTNECVGTPLRTNKDKRKLPTYK